ncbi:MAG TPA: pyridoxal-phosphate dependent enzyme, partial [Pyrinomonadaceae bacterium]|nr:pyridoxal-phosphate dependent enzyme [Pyrinomonadaceae bacterium]
CENLQRAGVFKMRGATNKILSLGGEERRRGVVAFSSGNHAQSVALAAREVTTGVRWTRPPMRSRAAMMSWRESMVLNDSGGNA